MYDARTHSAQGRTEDLAHAGPLRASLVRLDARVSLVALLPIFWSMFWLLNGLDKFFNAPTFFGVTRDASFVEYFARLSLPPEIALISLYACAVSEIVLGLGFAVALAWSAPVLTRLSLKGSALIFTLFSAADVLFGDRAELWEHGTYLLLVLVSILVLQNESTRGRVLNELR